MRGAYFICAELCVSSDSHAMSLWPIWAKPVRLSAARARSFPTPLATVICTHNTARCARTGRP